MNCFVVRDNGFLKIMKEDEFDIKEFECISILIDLGASESVIPKFMCMDIPTREIETSKRSCKYEAAGGHHIMNERENDITFVTLEVTFCNMSFQIAEINKGLGFVIDLIDIGHKIIFAPNGS